MVELDDDNRLLFDVLKNDGDGNFLVIKVLSSDKPAVVGERVATLAVENNWGGILIDGALRDVGMLRTIPLCIAATHVQPFRLRTKVPGRLVKTLPIGGVTLSQDDIVVVDEDGLISFPPSLLSTLAQQTND